MAHPSRIFKTPEELEKAWKGYKKHIEIEAEKWLKVQYVGKEGERVTDKYKLPMTMEGFEIYCYNNHGWVTPYFENRDGYYDDFLTICSRIRTEIRNDQITGGLLGVYNPSITQRLNNLKEQSEVNTNASINILNIDPLSDEE